MTTYEIKIIGYNVMKNSTLILGEISEAMTNHKKDQNDMDYDILEELKQLNLNIPLGQLLVLMLEINKLLQGLANEKLKKKPNERNDGMHRGSN